MDNVNGTRISKNRTSDIAQSGVFSYETNTILYIKGNQKISVLKQAKGFLK